MRRLLCLLLAVVVMTGLGSWTKGAQAADTAAAQTGATVSDEPGTNTPNILDNANQTATTYSIAKVGNTIVVGGDFTQVQNFNTSTTLARTNLLAFDATTGKVLPDFAPNPNRPVRKVLAAPDGQSVYVAGEFTSAAGQPTPGHLFKINVATDTVDAGFTAPTINGDIRDLDLAGNHLFIGGKFSQVGGVAQPALGTLYADSGTRDPYFNPVLSGLHNPAKAGSVTDVLQLSVNPQNTELVAVGNFTAVDGAARSQIAKFDIGNAPSGVDPTVHPTLSPWSTTLFTSPCSDAVETPMTDVEYAPSGTFFVVSSTGAYGGSSSLTGTSGCDVVARFEENATAGAGATWTAYTGGDTTWTVEVTDNVVYAGGHQRWQNNPSGPNTAGQGAVSREGIAALDTVNGMPYSWNPTRSRGSGVQDLLATSDGLYVGSDTTLIGHTTGNTYHARIAVLPLAGGETLPPLQPRTLPATVYTVVVGGSQLRRHSNFDGTKASAAVNGPSGPVWRISTGAFMVNGNLYKVNNTGTLTRISFNGTTFGPGTLVTTSDQLVPQTGWHNDAKKLTSIFYSDGFMYYTLAGTNALYHRAFEVEDGVVGQQRFATTTGSIKWANIRGAFVAAGKVYFASYTGRLYRATWDQGAHNLVGGTVSQLVAAGTGWNSRAMFPYQAAPN